MTRKAAEPHLPEPVKDPNDEFLIRGVLGGDVAALRALIDRYDRLVRFTVYRVSKGQCQRDPQWFESVASSTWEGFVRSIRRNPDRYPASVRAYIVRIARNQAISALRALPQSSQSLDEIRTVVGDPSGAPADHDPAAIAAELEHLEALRACVLELDGDDRAVIGQLSAITERRWREAADALNLPESTLRSRWPQILVRLRRCVERKTGESIAPGNRSGDY